MYLRGSTWWIAYYVNGQKIRESARSVRRDVAERMLARKLAATAHLRMANEPACDTPIANADDGLLTTEIGTASHYLISADLMNRGFEVFQSLCHPATCDMVVIRDGCMWRVEAKTGRVDKSGTVLLSLRRNRGRFDLLAAVIPGLGVFYQAGPKPTLKLTSFSRNPVACLPVMEAMC